MTFAPAGSLAADLVSTSAAPSLAAGESGEWALDISGDISPCLPESPCLVDVTVSPGLIFEALYGDNDIGDCAPTQPGVYICLLETAAAKIVVYYSLVAHPRSRSRSRPWVILPSSATIQATRSASGLFSNAASPSSACAWQSASDGRLRRASSDPNCPVHIGE